MILKILPNAKTMAAIPYCEKKVGGESMLMDASNFNFVIDANGDYNIDDFKSYMDMVSSLNSRVKNIQFHAALSCRGAEYSKEELTDLAKSYLDKMGYGNNPYLIYFHDDTKNNHVHIISTRVDKNGNKVNDSNERIRSMKVINELLKLDERYVARKAVSESLNYSFSTKPQLFLLLEKKGYRVNEDNGKVNLIRNGIINFSFDSALIDFRLKRHDKSKIEKRRYQIRAYIKKYMPGMTPYELKEFMKTKFGIDLEFFKSDGKYYGYTVIDNNSKAVFKGSDILPLKQILASSEENRNIGLIFYSLLESNTKLTYTEINEELKKYGLKLIGNAVKRAADNKDMLLLPPSVVDGIKYNNRLEKASLYNVDNQNINAIAAYFHVNPTDLSANNGKKLNTDFYMTLVDGINERHLDAKEEFNQMNMKLYSFENNVFLINPDKNEFVNMSSLGYDNLLSHSQNISIKVDNSVQNHDNYSFITIINSLITTNNSESVGANNELKKRKKRN